MAELNFCQEKVQVESTGWNFNWKRKSQIIRVDLMEPVWYKKEAGVNPSTTLTSITVLNVIFKHGLLLNATDLVFYQ